MTTTQGADSGDLRRIDHVPQSFADQEYLSWILFYSSLFGFEKAEPHDIADPRGLVQSLALEAGDRSIRITLNASAAPESSPNRFVRDYFGAGTQHIALESDNIVESVRKMRKAGLHLLPIPANYYDDLLARFGLPDAFAAGLRELDLLYDLDEGGEYLQCYTTTFLRSFFLQDRRAPGLHRLLCGECSHQAFGTVLLERTRSGLLAGMCVVRGSKPVSRSI